MAVENQMLGYFLTHRAPFGVLLNIALQMPIKDVVHYCHVNKRLRAVCRSSEFWRARIAQDYGTGFIDRVGDDTPFDQALYYTLHRRLYGPYPGNLRVVDAEDEDHYEDYVLVPDANKLGRYYTDRLVQFEGAVNLKFPGVYVNRPVTGSLEFENGEGRSQLSNGLYVEIIRPWGTHAQVVDLYMTPEDPNAWWPWKRVFKGYPHIEDTYERERRYHGGVDHALRPASSLFLDEVGMAPI